MFDGFLYSFLDLGGKGNNFPPTNIKYDYKYISNIQFI